MTPGLVTTGFLSLWCLKKNALFFQHSRGFQVWARVYVALLDGCSACIMEQRRWHLKQTRKLWRGGKKKKRCIGLGVPAVFFLFFLFSALWKMLVHGAKNESMWQRGREEGWMERVFAAQVLMEWTKASRLSYLLKRSSLNNFFLHRLGCLAARYEKMAPPDLTTSFHSLCLSLAVCLCYPLSLTLPE